MKASAIIRDLLNIFGVEVARCELSIDTITTMNLPFKSLDWTFTTSAVAML